MKASKVDYSELPKEKSTITLSKIACKAMIDLKALELKIFNVKDISSVADVMIIACGNSSRHVKSIADSVSEAAKAQGNPVLGIEGLETCEWVLVDLGDVIVHVMQTHTRDFYELEKLWVMLEEPAQDLSTD